MLAFLINIILVFLVLGILIFLHELGHFLAAKLTRTKVEAFAVGMGPKIVSKKWGETTYSLNWLPIGGYVSILGENDDPDIDLASIKKNPRNFQNKTVAQKVLILIAGVTMNLLTAVVIYHGFLHFLDYKFQIPGDIASYDAPFGDKRTETVAPLRYSAVTEDGNAKKAGVPESGYLAEIFDQQGSFVDLTTKQFGEIVSRNKNGKVEVIICENVADLKKSDVCNTFTVEVSDQGKIGVVIEQNVETYIQYRGLERLFAGFAHSANVAYLGVKNLQGIFDDASASGNYDTAVNSVSSPIGLYFLVDFLRGIGLVGILSLIADLSLTLFIINLLPIPALDGGRVMLVVLEAIFGKFYNKNIEAWAIRISFLLLMILMLGIVLKDIIFFSKLRDFFS